MFKIRDVYKFIVILQEASNIQTEIIIQKNINKVYLLTKNSKIQYGKLLVVYNSLVQGFLRGILWLKLLTLYRDNLYLKCVN